MGAATCPITCLLVFINTIFIKLGIVFVALGIVLKVGEKYFKPHLVKMLDNVSDLGNGVGLGDVNPAPTGERLDQLVGETLQMVGLVAIFLILLGVFMLVMGVLGCCGACCMVKCMLIAYIVVNLVIVLFFVILFGMFFTRKFDGQLKEGGRKLVRKFKGLDSYNVESIVMNFMQVTFKCCGMDGYRDYDEAAEWQRNRSKVTGGHVVVLKLLTPVTCCRMVGVFPAAKPKDSHCAVAPDATNSNKDNGCFAALYAEYEKVKGGAIGAFIGILLFLLLLAALAIALLVLNNLSEKTRVVPI